MLKEASNASIDTIDGNRKHRQDEGEEETDEGKISLKPAFKTLILRVLIIIIYMCLGALVFCAIEYKYKDTTIWKRKTKLIKNRLMGKYNITSEEMEGYEVAIEKSLIEEKDRHKEWSYYQSLYFASTVTTTIGYGHLTPQTQAGRLFLIVFALVGIPLNILALATVGEHITIGICYGISRISRMCCRTRTVRHINIKVMIVSITLMVIMLFTGGALYVTTENWTYIDSIYYCFVALATIGFGDLVPNQGQAPGSAFEKALWGLRVFYISIGLSLVSTVFTAISNAIEEINALLGWPRGDEKEEEKATRRMSRKETDKNKPAIMSKSFRLPNHITYVTEEEQRQENLANALPFPGLRPGIRFAQEETDIFECKDSRQRKFSETIHEDFSIIDMEIKTKPVKRRTMNGSLTSRSNSGFFLEKQMNHSNSSSELREKEGRTVGSIENDLKERTTDDVIIDIENAHDSSEAKIEKLANLRSLNSSQNDGYESSHHTQSDRDTNSNDTIATKNNRPSMVLDIESQISDFPHCQQNSRYRTQMSNSFNHL